MALVASALILSVAIPADVWQVTNVPGVFGDYVVWNADRSMMFASAFHGIIAARPEGNRLVREAVVSHQYVGGAIGYGDGWLYFVSRVNSDFMALNATDVHAIDPHGPFRLAEAIGGFVEVEKILVHDGVALVGGFSPFPTNRGAIVALNVSDPESITTDPSTLRALYWIYFETGVVDMAIQGSLLYVISGGRLDIFDLAVFPPEVRMTYLLGGWLGSLDVQRELLAVTDAGLANKTVLFYQVSGSQISFVSKAVLAGQPIAVTLEGDRAYVSWHPDDNFYRGFAVFDVRDARSPRLIYTLATRDGGGNAHLVNRGIAYLLGNDDVAIVREATVPSILVASLPQTVLLAIVAAAGISFILSRVRRKATGSRVVDTDKPYAVEKP